MMTRAFRAAAAACLIVASGLVLAQTPPAPPPALPEVSPQYVVSYIEVAPKAAETAAKLIAAYGEATRKEAGVIQFEVFQRVGTPHHFAIVGQWSETKAFLGHGEAAGKSLKGALAGHLTAAYDERRHHTLNAGKPIDAKSGLVGVTHVDIIPTEREPGIASVKLLADQSRGTPGNLRYDALTQSTRPNHMTLVEVWQDEASYHGHVVSGHLKAFREALLPRSGSLYDERLYKALN